MYSSVPPPLFPQGNKYHGINVRKGSVTNMVEENVVQPLLVSTSAIGLASECVRMILKARLRALYISRPARAPARAFVACEGGGESDADRLFLASPRVCPQIDDLVPVR